MTERGTRVQIHTHELVVWLTDGRAAAAPVSSFPRLQSAPREERERWEWVDQGTAIRWSELDEQVSVEQIVKLHLESLGDPDGKELAIGDLAPCEQCGQRGEWLLLYPSLGADSPRGARCPSHTPEDDWS